MEKEKTNRSAALVLILITVMVVIVALFLVVSTRHEQEAEAEREATEERVDAHRNTAFSNKWLLDEELTDRDANYIESALLSIRKTYEDRICNVHINKSKSTYTMEKLGENIYFICTEGTTETAYPKGREGALARHIVSLDKDLPIEEQDDIILGKRQTVKAVIGIKCEADQNTLTELAKKLSSKYDKAPVNATIDADMHITREKNGRVLDTSTIIKDMTSYLDSLEKTDFFGSYHTTKVEAAVQASYLKLIDTPVSRYVTSLIPTSIRGKNIALAASRIDGKVLKPDEQMSFLEALYDDSDGKSYGKAGGFLNNRVVQVEGGGICQVSTTAYDAFLKAGIIPVERYPHMCKVSYAPGGFDAALAVGTKDLVVKNTLEYPLMIRAKVKGDKLGVWIYSYSKATKGLTYKPRSKTIKSGVEYEMYLDVYKGSELQESKLISNDTYKKLKG
ncbi:MAG: VanW family protein [Eubacterium sp.]|nr:VanW family protein [Eubacterium sp.]